MSRVKVSKAAKIREILATNPNAKPMYIVARLAKRKIEVTNQQVSAIKHGFKNAFPGKGKKRKTDAPRLTETLKKMQSQNGNGHSAFQFEITDILSFERRVNQIGIENAEKILIAMKE